MTKLTLISDTHDRQNDLVLPYGDILLHAGDYSMYGGEQESKRFFDWFQKQPHRHKIFIAGNHDLSMENPKSKQVLMDYIAAECPDITYLENEAVTVEGIKIYGTPFTPSFGRGWAFNRRRGTEIEKEWASIPQDTDILLVHGPPYKYGDLCARGAKEHVGCEDLFNRIVEVNPTLCVFGHIHEGHGMYSARQKCNTTFINASLLDEDYFQVNDPIEIEWENFI